MTTMEAVLILDRHMFAVMGDKDVVEAWRVAKSELTRDCADCVNFGESCYAYYTYPCNECKSRARDSFERKESGGDE